MSEMSNRHTTLAGRIQPTRLGQMLRLSRTVAQRDLRSVATEIGTSPATLMRIEHGQAFDAATLFKLWAWLLEKQP